MLQIWGRSVLFCFEYLRELQSHRSFLCMKSRTLHRFEDLAYCVTLIPSQNQHFYHYSFWEKKKNAVSASSICSSWKKRGALGASVSGPPGSHHPSRAWTSQPRSRRCASIAAMHVRKNVVPNTMQSNFCSGRVQKTLPFCVNCIPHRAEPELCSSTAKFHFLIPIVINVHNWEV